MGTADEQHYRFSSPSLGMFGPDRDFPAIHMGQTLPRGKCGGGDMLQISLEDVFLGRAWCNSPTHVGTGQPHRIIFHNKSADFECEIMSAAISFFVHHEQPAGDDVWFIEDLMDRVPIQRVVPQREMLDPAEPARQPRDRGDSD